MIHGGEDGRELDSRVDDQAEPVTELRGLYEVSLERFQPFVACLPGRHDGAGSSTSRSSRAVDAARPSGSSPNATP